MRTIVVLLTLLLLLVACPTEPEFFMVTFDSQGGSAIEPLPVQKGSPATCPADPILDGSIFNGWFTDPLEGSLWNFNTPITADITLYAHWSPDTQTYTVSFETQGGGAVFGQQVEAGSFATEPEDPSKDGAVFQGWYTASVAGDAWNFSTPISNHTTLYAHWLYTLAYASANDSEGTVTGDLEQQVQHGMDGTTVAAVPVEGFSFDKWSDDSVENPRTDEDVTDSLSVTAYFSWNVYSLSYTATVGGTLQGPVLQNVSHGEDGAMVEAIPDTGHVFAGWSDGLVPTSIRTDRNVRSDITVSAQFDPITYTVSFDTHGGSVIADQLVDYQGKPIKPSGDPTRTGYRFKGWFSDPVLESYFDFDETVASLDNDGDRQIVVHAQWIERFMVTYDSDGGDAVLAETVDAGTPITAPTAPTKTGSTFTGWYTGPGGTGDAWTFGSDTITSDTTLYAAWNVDSWWVTYRVNGAAGTQPDIVQHLYGSFVQVASQGDLAKDGYEFNGWNTNEDGTGQGYGPGAKFTMPASDVYLYAQWTNATRYPLQYDANGGAGTVPTGGEFINGTKVFVQDNIGDLTKTGYYFDGWNTSADGSGTSLSPGAAYTMPSEPVTLHAHWSVQQYTVYLNFANGDEMGALLVDHGDTVPAQGDPTYTGHTFSGWFADAAYQDPWVFATDTIIGQTTLHAKWTINSHNLSYEANGGSGTPPAAGISYDYGQEVSVQLNTFTRNGYTFKEWNTIAEGTGTAYQIAASFSMPDQDVVLHAIWTPNEYTLTYHGNGHELGEVPPGSVEKTGSTVTIAGYGTMEKTGHRVSAWNEAADGSATSWSPSAFLIMPAESVSLYAQWEPLDCTVEFNPDGGAFAGPTEQSVPYASRLTEPAMPVKDGNAFGGWRRSDGTVWNFGADVATNHSDAITLTALWLPDQYLVQFNSQGGSAVQPVYIGHGTAVSEPTSPIRNGYTFTGWFDSAIGGVSWDFNQTITTSITLHAQWTRESYEVVFSTAGGTVIPNQNIEYESLVTQPADPMRPPYEFGGWYADEALTDPWDFLADRVASPITLYAKWELPNNSKLLAVAGDSHTLTVDSSGRLRTFGANDFGQLGLGSTSDSNSPAETLRGGESFGTASAAAGLGHTLVVDQDGSLWVTGMNRYYGQLGADLDPASIEFDQSNFMAVGVGGSAVAVAAGSVHSLVLLDNGDLLGAGYNGLRQLVIDDTTPQKSFVKIASGVESVWAGGFNTFFKKSDGTLWGAGYNRSGQLGTGNTSEFSEGAIPIVYAASNTPVRDVKQVAVGGAHALLLLEDGRLYAAGLNTSGQLGLGSTANALQLTFVMDGVAYVAAGETHSAVIKLDGSLWTFGDNSFGQLGDGTRTNRSTPVHVTTFGNKAYKVAAGYGHTVVVLHDLTTWSVGLNRDGQLGLGDTVNRLEFTKLED
ncbi:MAG: hypothetical protein CVV52_06085 [Spirochaetae bacterium HGW-Spirochaetae-8]|nr:MAG: hypothetical protein CVV52_06085 [Spirochaetae bacterium HGW-Spirochaetae-8]